jgi:hypothetical protein
MSDLEQNQKQQRLLRAGLAPELVDEIIEGDRLAESLGLTDALVEKALERIAARAPAVREKSLLAWLSSASRPAVLVAVGACACVFFAFGVGASVSWARAQQQLQAEIAQRNALLKTLEGSYLLKCDPKTCDREKVKSSAERYGAEVNGLAAFQNWNF